MSVGTNALVWARCLHHPWRMSATQPSPRWSSAASGHHDDGRDRRTRGAPAGSTRRPSPIAGEDGPAAPWEVRAQCDPRPGASGVHRAIPHRGTPRNHV